LGLVLSYISHEGNVVTCRAEKLSETNKPKAFIHWTSKPHSISIRSNIYDRIFKSPEPEAVKGGFKNDINWNSLEVRNGKIDGSLLSECLANLNAKRKSEFEQVEILKYQFERNGYFCLDRKESSATCLVFNKTVSLKEDKNKK